MIWVMVINFCGLYYPAGIKFFVCLFVLQFSSLLSDKRRGSSERGSDRFGCDTCGKVRLSSTPHTTTKLLSVSMLYFK